MHVIDSHAHLDLTLQASAMSLSEILGKDLERAVHISLNPFDFSACYQELSADPRVCFATGCYPDCTTRPDYSLSGYMKALAEALASRKHIALGEAGIDFKYEKYGPRDKQTALFEAQIALAEELGLPLIVHSRDTFEECFACLKHAPKVKSVFHCFSYSPKEAERLLEAGHFLSFTGNLTYKSAQNIREAALIAPLDRILFETDCPYLSPHPFRSEVNLPYKVEQTYRFFAELRALPLDTLISQVHENFYAFFKV